MGLRRPQQRSTSPPARAAVVVGGVVGEDKTRRLLEAEAVVEHGTTPLRRVIPARVEHLPHHVAEAGLRPPVVIARGEVVRFRNRIRWFGRDPEAQSPTISPTSAREG